MGNLNERQFSHSFFRVNPDKIDVPNMERAASKAVLSRNTTMTENYGPDNRVYTQYRHAYPNLSKRNNMSNVEAVGHMQGGNVTWYPRRSTLTDYKNRVNASVGVAATAMLGGEREPDA